MLEFIKEIGRKSEGFEAALFFGIRAINEELDPGGMNPEEWKILNVLQISPFIVGQSAFNTPGLTPSGPGALFESEACRACQI